MKKTGAMFSNFPFFSVTLDNMWKNTQCLSGDVCA